jgi:hypothetical protein
MRRLGMVVLAGMLVTLGACARGPEPERPAAKPAWQAPPASSPLAKVQAGMTEQEVQALLGVPSDQNMYVTGKAFMPFYYGRDRHRIAYFYKGVGRVVFAGGGGFSRTGRVSRVEYDPAEPGRAR